ncbi:hypothetical protein [Kitasatospora griseola]
MTSFWWRGSLVKRTCGRAYLVPTVRFRTGQ